MTIRRTARWQHCIDDRVLEYLQEENCGTAEGIANKKGVHATEVQVQERCRLLADVDLVAFLTEDEEIVELTMKGKEYLNGEIDVDLYPRPRHPSVLSKLRG